MRSESYSSVPAFKCAGTDSSPVAPLAPVETKPELETEQDQKTRHAPLYHVILHNDDFHTYQYVIIMLMKLFGMSAEKAFQHAKEVDTEQVTIVDTTTLERAELKRDQIKAYGKDPLMGDKSPGSMYASIEPADK